MVCKQNYFRSKYIILCSMLVLWEKLPKGEVIPLSEKLVTRTEIQMDISSVLP